MLLWSWLFEALVQLPPMCALFPNPVGDAWDIVAYAGGAVLAGRLPTPLPSLTLRSPVDCVLWIGFALLVGVFVLVTQNDLSMPSGH